MEIGVGRIYFNTRWTLFLILEVNLNDTTFIQSRFEAKNDSTIRQGSGVFCDLNMNKTKRLRANRHEFLKTLFPSKGNTYAVHKMNGFVLVRQFNANNNEWEVAVYTEASYAKVEAWKNR